MSYSFHKYAKACVRNGKDIISVRRSERVVALLFPPLLFLVNSKSFTLGRN